MTIIIALSIFLLTIYKIVIDARKPKINQLNRIDYENNFKPIESRLYLFKEKDRKEEALKFAIETRKFEIDLYWRRAGYFWAFIALAFTALYNVADYTMIEDKRSILSNQIIPLAVICLGILLSVAFLLVNLASKVWQQNWENHIHLLQDEIMGRLYSIVFHKKTYSVSKVNEILSQAIIVVWVLILYQYLKNMDIDLLDVTNENTGDFILVISVTLYFLSAMLIFYGRTISKITIDNIYEIQETNKSK